MKTNFYHITKSISRRISVNKFAKITGKNLVLPFYHTVSPAPKPHFSESDFFRLEHQFVDDLDFFTQNFENSGINEFDPSKKQFHLSFDDGMSEIYTVIFPLIRERGLNATVFVNTDFVDNKKMFVSHKKSLIQNQLKHSKQSRHELSDFLNAEESELQRQVICIKKEKEIDEIAKLIHVNFNDYLSENQPYLTTSQIIELKNAGFVIGNHGKSHRNFNTLKFEDQKAEIESVNAFLKEIGVEELFFCFPYGDFNIKKELFEWMYSEAEIKKSFGISGLKNDGFTNHHHRILMENGSLSAEEIIKGEYFYYFWKSFLNKNKISR